MTEGAVHHSDIAVRVDTCWSRIGTRGDQSCPALEKWVRCRNCPVYEQAAARLLDRPLVEDAPADAGALAAGPVAEARAADTARHSVADTATHTATHTATQTNDAPSTHSAVVFRVAEEWLALPTAALRQIEDLRPIHSLPHRRNRVVLGVVNVRGALTVAVSLRELLRLEGGSARQAARNGAYARLLVAAHRGEPVAFPVDEVHGVLRVAAHQLKPVPDTLTRASAAHAAGVFAWRETTVGLLDTDRVFTSLNQSLR
jgi:chemotaxis-related protein WspD